MGAQTGGDGPLFHFIWKALAPRSSSICKIVPVWEIPNAQKCWRQTMNARSSGRRTRRAVPLVLFGSAVAALVGGCGGDGSPAAAAPLSCDDSMKTLFAAGADTTVVAVKAFSKGASLSLAATPAAGTPVAANE